jgi:hypothetical protein
MNQPYKNKQNTQVIQKNTPAVVKQTPVCINPYKSSINFIHSDIMPFSEVAKQVLPAVIQSLFFTRFKTLSSITAKQLIRGESYESLIVCA